MSNRMTIITALKLGLIKPKDFVEYVLDKASVSFSPEETNTQNVQTASTEYNMGSWYAI